MAVEMKTMDIKGTEQVIKPAQTQVTNKAIKTQGIFDFLADIKAEFAKINWTTPDELRAYTKIVVATTFILGMGLYFVDVLIQFVLSSFAHLVRLLGV